MIQWSNQAIEELEECLVFLSSKSIIAAQNLFRAINYEVSLLEDFPELGRLSRKGIRILVVAMRYRIAYQIDGKTISVLHVKHSRQKFV